MRGRLVRRGAATVAALAVGVAGVVGVVPTLAQADPAEATPLSVPGMAVSLAQAGELGLWGDNTFAQATVPASLAGVAVSQVVFPNGAGLALTADGRVVGWGSNPDQLEKVPTEVAAAKVAQIATSTFGGGYAGAVTRDGQVMMWGKRRAFANPSTVPAGLSGVKQLAISEYSAAALKSDGSVVAWGEPDGGQTAVPEGLKATAIVAQYRKYFALTEQGTVVSWGLDWPYQPLPPAVQVPGNVKAISSGSAYSLALLADNTLVVLNEVPPQCPSNAPCNRPPSEFMASDPVLLANGGGQELAVVGRDRTIHFWTYLELPGEVPAALNGRDLAQITLGFGHSNSESYPGGLTGGVIITKMLRAELPQVTGVAKVGAVLTGVPGTFSAAPDSVSSQWLVDGTPVAASGAQLSVTAAMVGKKISYQSTASKAGETTISSTSDAVTAEAVTTPVVKTVSKTKVAKVTVAKKAANVVVTGKVTASKSPAGKAKVTIKKGKKVIVAKIVGVSAKGALKVTVKKFAQLVAKKLKAKGKKAKTAYRGKYSVTISYAGNTLVKASAGSGRFTIKK